jgi:hypothetical protein
MFKTGTEFIDLLTVFTGVFLPLVPVVIILTRRIYTQDSLAFLMILCLLNFVQGLITLTIQLTPLMQVSMQHIFTLLDMLVLSQLFKTSLNANRKSWVNVISIGLLSAVITFFLLRGTGEPNPILDGLVDGFVLVLIVVSLPLLVRTSNLQIFQSALFWIAIGTVFYYATALLLEGSNLLGELSAKANPVGKTLLLAMANLARYFFYALAVCLPKRPSKVLGSRSALDL